MDYINDTSHSVQDLCELLGPFFATQCTLGGVFEKNHVLEVTLKDTETSVMAELSASYGANLCGGNSKFERKNRSSFSQARQSTSWHCEGGDSTLWLGDSSNESKFESIQAKWAVSLNQSNLFPYELKLKPIWALVNGVNPSRAAAMRQWFEAKWSREIWNPTRFLVLSHACILLLI